MFERRTVMRLKPLRFAAGMTVDFPLLKARILTRLTGRCATTPMQAATLRPPFTGHSLRSLQNPRKPAVHVDARSGHVACRVGGEKCDHVGDLFRLAHAAERRGLADFGVMLLDTQPQPRSGAL